MAANEKVYFDEGGVKVTNSRFIVPSQTYAMSGITSVKSVYTQPIKGPVILGILGLIMLFVGNTGALIFGALLIAGAILWFIKGKKHFVLLSSSSGEAEALSSSNAAYIGKIVSALNEAIVERG